MSTIAELEDKVKELLDEIETLKREKKNEEFEYLFKQYEQYWLVGETGKVKDLHWDTECFDQPRYEQGHIFKTKQEAERERDKRALLVRFRQYRDKCNGDWKPGTFDCKYFIAYDSFKNVLESSWNDVWDNFYTFGYFKNERDCLRAIDLFGDEIKRLWVDE